MNREECNDMVMEAYFNSLVGVNMDKHTDKLKAIYEVQREEIRNEEQRTKT